MAYTKNSIKKGKPRMAIRPNPPKLAYATQTPKNDVVPVLRYIRNCKADRLEYIGIDLADYPVAFVDRPA